MIAVKKQNLLQGAICLICGIVLYRFALPLEGTEFSGGTLTGRLLSLSMVSMALFLLAMVVTFFVRRFGALIALAGCILGLPIYLYFVAPGPFRKVFGGNYSVPLQANFVWDSWAVAGILTIATMIAVLLWSLASPGNASTARAGQSVP